MLSTECIERARGLIKDPPKLHFWNDEWQVGGLNSQVGNRFIALMSELEAPAVMETGAGASTLLFLALGARSVTSIAPDRALGDRILHAASERRIETTGWRFLAERSENALPVLAASGETVDLALIDGNHGWPSVFVDFCYLNMMLGAGGLLIVDDLQLYSCAQLFLLLRQQPEYDLSHLDGKQAVFRKTVDRKFLPDWRDQPFIVTNSVTL